MLVELRGHAVTMETQTSAEASAVDMPNPTRLVVSFRFRGLSVENREIAHALAREKSIVWCEVSLEGRRMLAAGRTHAVTLDEQSFVKWDDTVELNCSFAEAQNITLSYKVWSVDKTKSPLLIGEWQGKLETKSMDSFRTMEPSTMKLILGPIRALLTAK